MFAVPWRYLDAETAVSLLKRAVYTIKRKVDSVKSLCQEHHFDDAETRETMAYVVSQHTSGFVVASMLIYSVFRPPTTTTATICTTTSGTTITFTTTLPPSDATILGTLRL